MRRTRTDVLDQIQKSCAPQLETGCRSPELGVLEEEVLDQQLVTYAASISERGEAVASPLLL
jgi:hypothetical protein